MLFSLTLGRKTSMITPFNVSTFWERPLANSKQATKRAKQALKNRDRNRWQKSRMVTQVKKVIQFINEKNLEQAKAAYTAAVSLLDRLANKGIIHKNKAARHKSRLNQHIKALAS